MTLKATRILEEEHHVIQSVAASLAIVGADIQSGKRVATKTLRNLARFLEVFVGQCHKEKEESHLFVMLEKKGVPSGGCPIAVLSHEHVKLHDLISQFADCVELYVTTHGDARAPLEKTIRALLELLPGHIWKEDFLLFPMADKVLSPEDHKTLLEEFNQVETQVGAGVHHGFERLAKAVEEIVHHA